MKNTNFTYPFFETPQKVIDSAMDQCTRSNSGISLSWYYVKIHGRSAAQNLSMVSDWQSLEVQYRQKRLPGIIHLLWKTTSIEIPESDKGQLDTRDYGKEPTRFEASDIWRFMLWSRTWVRISVLTAATKSKQKRKCIEHKWTSRCTQHRDRGMAEKGGRTVQDTVNWGDFVPIGKLPLSILVKEKSSSFVPQETLA